MLLFSKTEAHENIVDGAETINKVMINVDTRRMLLFVHYVVQKVHILDLKYQSVKFSIYNVHSTVSDSYKYLLSLFVKSNLIEVCRCGE